MMFILAMIGLALILWYVSKQLKKFGAWLTKMSYVTADYIESQRKKNSSVENLNLKRQNKKIAESIRIIKGADSNVTYTSRVRDEIDLLEKEINGIEE